MAIGPLTFVAALSYEDRSVSGFENWLRQFGHEAELTLLDYGNQPGAPSAMAAAREKNLTRFRRMADKAGVSIDKVPVNPYSMTDFEDLLAGKRLRGSAEHLCIDLSCMTRPHVMAAARGVVRHTSWSVGYTTPLSYGDLDASLRTTGWRDILYLPLGDSPTLRNQGMAIGVMLLGLETARASAAFEELEAATGVALIYRRQDRPDFHRATQWNNRSLLSYLSSLKMPGPKANMLRKYLHSDGWEIATVDMNNLVEDMRRVVLRYLSVSTEMDPPSPVILYPFGPKLSIFIAALLMLRTCPSRAWAVYPLPFTHPLDYSDGVLDTQWMTAADLAEERPE